MKDMKTMIAAAVGAVPQILSANHTATLVDLQGFNSATLVVSTGAIVGAGDFSVKLQESDTETLGDFTDVDADDLLGSFSATLPADSVETVGYRGTKRYVRVVFTRNGGTSIAASAAIIKGHPENAPTE